MARFKVGDIVVAKIARVFDAKLPSGAYCKLQGWAFHKVIFVHPEYGHCTIKSDLYPQGSWCSDVKTLAEWEEFTKTSSSYKLVNTIDDVKDLPI